MSKTSRSFFQNNYDALYIQGMLHIRGGDYILDSKRNKCDNVKYKGVDSAEELSIILALRKGKRKLYINLAYLWWYRKNTNKIN